MRFRGPDCEPSRANIAIGAGYRENYDMVSRMGAAKVATCRQS